MSNELSGRTFLVTGASRGIGKAISVRLASSGANIIVCRRSMDSNLVSSRFQHCAENMFSCVKILVGNNSSLVDIIADAVPWGIPEMSDLVDLVVRIYMFIH